MTNERLAEIRRQTDLADWVPTWRMTKEEGVELLDLAEWALAQRERNRTRVASYRGKKSAGGEKAPQKPRGRPKTARTVEALLETGKVSRGMPVKPKRSILDTPPIPPAVQEVVRQMEQPEVWRPVLGSAFLSLKGPMQTDLTKPQFKTKGKEKK